MTAVHGAEEGAVEVTVLDPITHARLIKDLDRIAETAGVQPNWIRRSALPYIHKVDADWIRHFHAYRAQGKAGLMVSGTVSPTGVPISTRFQAIVGALIRNFVDARFMSLKSVVDAAEEQNLPDPTVLVIPNLFQTTVGKSMPDWKVQTMYDVLLHRHASNKPTVIYVEDKNKAEAVYGPALMAHINTTFRHSPA